MSAAWQFCDLKRRWRQVFRRKQCRPDGQQPASETAASNGPPSNVPGCAAGGSPSNVPGCALEDPSSAPRPEAASEAASAAQSSVDRTPRPTGCCLCNWTTARRPAPDQSTQQTAGSHPESGGPRTETASDPTPAAPARTSVDDRMKHPQGPPATDPNAAGPSNSAEDPCSSETLAVSITWLNCPD